MHKFDFEKNFMNLTEFMDKSLYQEAAASMEEAIALYAINGREVVEAVLLDIQNLLNRRLPDEELLNYIERHSDYLAEEGAHATFVLIRSILNDQLV